MNNLLLLLTQLIPLATPFVPAAGSVPEIAAIVAALINYIRQQSGMTTDEILDRALKTLDDNEKELLKDQLQLGP